MRVIHVKSRTDYTLACTPPKQGLYGIFALFGGVIWMRKYVKIRNLLRRQAGRAIRYV